MADNIKISDELMADLTKRYGEIPEHVGIRNIYDEETYEASIKFYRRFNIPTKFIDDGVHNLAVANGIAGVCDTIERMIFSGEPNAPDVPFLGISNVKFHVTNNMPDDIVYVSPKTYHDITRKLHVAMYTE